MAINTNTNDTFLVGVSQWTGFSTGPWLPACSDYRIVMSYII
jgi:hypothetical protein